MGTGSDYHYFFLAFNNGSYEKSSDITMGEKGTYTTNGNSITFTITHIEGLGYDGSRVWYSRAEYKKRYPEYEVDEIFYPETLRYSISGNTLIIGDYAPRTYHRR
jgi:hypothetical protein